MIKSHFLPNRILSLCVLASMPGSLWAADSATALDQSRTSRSILCLATGDGVVSIGQDRAMSGGVTPGDAPGFPVTISQSGSYRLSGNLTVPDLNTTAIQITADFVTLDLNGFSIVGPAVCTQPGGATACPARGTGFGVVAGGEQAPFPRGVKVLNGFVRGMGLMGILLNGSGSFVEKVTVDSNVGGGVWVAGTVLASAASLNGSFGIVAGTVRDSIARQNFGDGIILSAEGGVATGNVSSANGGYGIAVQFGTATGNTVFLNQTAGFLARCPSTIVGNTIVTNGLAGIETHGDTCAFANNGANP